MLNLEQVLADARGDAAVLRRAGNAGQAEYIEQLCDRVADATEEYRRFVSEADACLRSSKTSAWFRSQFPRWQADGNAELRGRTRYYRLLIVPKRADLDAARSAGRQRAANG
jgi:hypothetical protein